MKILDVLQEDAILSDLQSQDKKGVIEELVMPLVKTAGVKFEELVKILMERERLGSTGIGGGIGIPHGKLRRIRHDIAGNKGGTLSSRYVDPRRCVR